jgi:hypothetical protein
MHKMLKMADVIDAHMKHRMVTEFFTTEEVSPTEIHRCQNSEYGKHTEHTTDVSTMRCCIRHFKSGQTKKRQVPKWPACNSSNCRQQEPY